MNIQATDRKWTLGLILVLGLLVRLPYMSRPGFRQDMAYYRSCASYLSEHSITTIYRDAAQIEGGIVNYPPVYLFILQGLGKAARMVSSEPFNTTWFLFLLKSVNVLSDLLIGLLLYRLLRREMDFDTGAVGLALFWLNPGAIYLGAFFGQTDSLFTLFLVAAAYAARFSPFLSGCACGIALGTKLQTLPFLPLYFLPYLIRRDVSGLFKTGAGFGAALVVLTLPFAIAGEAGRMVNSCFVVSLGWSTSLTMGAFNLWQLYPEPLSTDQGVWGFLFGSDGLAPAQARFLTVQRLGLILFSMAYFMTILGFVRHRKEDRFRLWWALSAASLAFFFLPTRIHERYLFPFLAFAVPNSAAGKNRFLQCIYLAISVFFLLNLMVVCPPDSRPVPLHIVHTTEGADVLAVLGVFLAFLWAVGRPAIATRRGLFFAGGLLVVLLFAFGQKKMQTPRLSLADLPYKNVYQEWETPRRDLSLGGTPLRIVDKVFSKGIGTHAASRITFAVPEGVERLEAWIGADAEVIGGPERTSIVFIVELDGEEVFRSDLFSSRTPANRIEVPLKNAREISLITDDTDDGNLDDHADWCGLFLD